MSYEPGKDERLDPRCRKFLAQLPVPVSPGDVRTREELLAEAASDEGLAAERFWRELFDTFDDEAAAPREGLRIEDYKGVSSPDGNAINLQLTRPESRAILGCVYYLHGGGMASGSCYYGAYQAWARMLAHQGVAVVLVDFRNSIVASSVEEVAPYPSGLDDCHSGLGWIHEHAGALGVDRSRVVVAGESGGGNLTLALGMRLKREERLDAVKGLYALCPYIAGMWPQDRYPSSYENEGVYITVHGNRAAMSYGIDAYERRDPLAWPGLAADDDLRGLPQTVISVNECDPLRDEGVEFYRRLIRNGVPARCRQVMGSFHANELAVSVAPDISRDTARDLAGFCTD